MNKTLLATLVAAMLGVAGVTGTAVAKDNGGASTATPTTPEQDAKFKDGVKNTGRKIKEKAHNVVAKVKGDKPAAAQHAKVKPAKRHVATRHATRTHATHTTRSTARSEKVSRVSDVPTTQTREQRMEEARLNWERNRKM